MSDLIEIMQRVVRQELARARTSLLGVVTATFPHTGADDQNNFEASVQLKYEDLELRRVPIAVGHLGMAAPPRVGDLVLVQFIAGDLNQPVITGRFYTDEVRPPLHKADEVMFEQRLGDGAINQLRFAADGSIILQRKVAKPEDNSEADATIRLDADGNVELIAGQKTTIRLGKDDQITITTDSKEVVITCSKLTVDGELLVKKAAEFQADLKVSGAAGSTTISGNEITGA